MTETKSDDDMTPDERLAWLRERGVHIETAEERKRAQVANAIRQAENMTEDEISYVLVPADSSKPLKEFSFRPADMQVSAGDLLLEHLKPAFQSMSQGKAVDIELLKNNASQTLAASPNAPATVSDEALQQVAKEANIEVFSLVKPMPANKFTGVNIYLDEVGMLKRLPLNKRASDFALRAGFNPPPQFYGDVFLGRIQQKPQLKNVSFVLGFDTAMDAPWLDAAATENISYQLEMNRITGQTNAQQPGVAGQDGKAKEEEEGYSWTQTEEELELVLKLPGGTTSKEIEVKFKPQNVSVFHKKEPKMLLELFERVDVDSCTWTLDKGSEEKKLVISMEKQEAALWPRIKD